MSAIPRRTPAPPVPRIRRARPEDVDHLLAIERASFVEPWEPDTIRQSIGWFPSSCFVAEWQNEVVGFLIGSPQPVNDGFYGHICNLAVAEEYRGMGIGRLLVRRAEHQFLMEGALGIQLEVRESNKGARSFYKKLGYEEVFLFPQYYSNGEHAVVMMKWFRY
jgi:ribosomal-protein-alanine N-acetyltransferase